MCSAHGDQQKALDLLELELYTSVSHHMDPGYQIQAVSARATIALNH